MSEHAAVREWLRSVLAPDSAYGSDLVLSGFVRLVTDPRAFRDPAPVESALDLADIVPDQAQAVRIDPGPRRWGIFRELCRSAGARGLHRELRDLSELPVGRLRRKVAAAAPDRKSFR